MSENAVRQCYNTCMCRCVHIFICPWRLIVLGCSSEAPYPSTGSNSVGVSKFSRTPGTCGLWEDVRVHVAHPLPHFSTSHLTPHMVTVGAQHTLSASFWRDRNSWKNRQYSSKGFEIFPNDGDHSTGMMSLLIYNHHNVQGVWCKWSLAVYPTYWCWGSRWPCAKIDWNSEKWSWTWNQGLLSVYMFVYMFVCLHACFCCQAATARLVVSLVHHSRNDLTPYAGMYYIIIWIHFQ